MWYGLAESAEMETYIIGTLLCNENSDSALLCLK
jgi:hypothetical protein